MSGNDHHVAASADPVQRTTGQSVLGQWEKASQFHSTLQDIYFDQTIDVKLRSLAIIYLKNGIARYWRKTAEHAIQLEEKEIIRQKQLTNMDESNKKLAIQQALVTAKISRTDFPNDWPDLLQTLIPIVQASFRVSAPLDQTARNIQHNSLYTLHHVVKTLCSKTLPSSRRLLHQLAPELFNFVSSIFFDEANSFVTTIQQVDVSDPTNQINDKLVLVRYALKCLRRLVVHGFQDPDKIPAVAEFIGSLTRYMQTFMQFRQTLPKSSSGLYATLSSFCILVESTPQVQDNETVERIMIQALRLLKMFIKNPSFNTISQVHKDERMNSVIQILDTQLFKQDQVVTFAKLLVSHYIRLSEEDLTSWEDDPESFIQSEDSDQWEFSIKSCAERVLMDLVSKNRDLLCPILVSMLREASVPTTQSNILLKDAVYSSIGLTAHDLFDWLDFADWTRTHLVHEVSRKEPEFKIIRRRVACIIGQWVQVKAPEDLRSTLYQILLSLMGRDEDLVVRLSAVINLQRCVDDFDFQPQSFQPYLESNVTAFIQLLEDVDEFENKMKIINCLVVIIERMDEQARVIGKLLKALRSESIKLNEIVMPILQQSVDTSKPGHLYLVEEGIILWLTMLQNATTCTSSLLELVPYATQLMQSDGDNLKRILRIIEAYIVLDPVAVMQMGAVSIMSTITQMLGQLKAEASSALLRVVDIALQGCHAAQCFPSICQVILSSGLLSRLVQVVIENTEMSIITVGFLSILARIAVYDPIFLTTSIQQIGSNSNPPIMDILGQLLDRWLEKVDAMGHGKQRKLTALAMSNLLGTAHPIVLARIDGVFGVLTSISSQLHNMSVDESIAFAYDVRDEDDDEFSLDKKRQDALMVLDPVYTNDSLAQYMRLNLAALEHELGSQQAMKQLLSMADPDLLLQIKHFLK
ncbi:hypothetical protein BDEG_22751 [Batrachochytrium dendrobatidis JEL423]|uniref:Importin N-terminal domain-containing protein n=1 Tax=Batrachochytrium dendrobatidis (strain JEL423) TaxID=403673 RepID=A0A177WGG1_BATDL|nr:hypothetical protein BDEG_22751 [Batrachochytrium dendrobatidis JEL423]